MVWEKKAMQSNFQAEGKRRRSYFTELEIAYIAWFNLNSGSYSTDFFSASGTYPE